MRMKSIFAKGIGLGMGLLLLACDPIDEDSWFNNETVELDWTYANPETGYRPSSVDVFTLSYYPQDVKDKQFRFDYELTDDEITLPLYSGYYDLLAISDDDRVEKENRFKEARVIFQTTVDSLGNRYITDEAESMIYKGQIQNVDVNYSDRRQRKVELRRLLRTINFVVNVFDYKEIMKPVSLDLSGVASVMRLHDEAIDPDSEAILCLQATKQGRDAENELGMHTIFKTSCYVLGVTGNNVAHVYFYNYRDELQRVQVDLTAYLSSWNTEEAVVYINLNAFQNTGMVERWDSVSSDIIINNTEEN